MHDPVSDAPPGQPASLPAGQDAGRAPRGAAASAAPAPAAAARGPAETAPAASMDRARADRRRPEIARPDSAPGAAPVADRPIEIDGPSGPEPTRYGDWERKGRCIDF